MLSEDMGEGEETRAAAAGGIAFGGGIGVAGGKTTDGGRTIFGGMGAGVDFPSQGGVCAAGASGFGSNGAKGTEGFCSCSASGFLSAAGIDGGTSGAIVRCVSEGGAAGGNLVGGTIVAVETGTCWRTSVATGFSAASVAG
jgi:hypothetical protein